MRIGSALTLALLASAPTPALAQAASRPTAAAPSQGQLKLAARYSARCKGVSLLVMHRGKVILEDYPPLGGARRRAHRLASGTKSFSGVAALFGVHEGFLKLDEKISDTLQAWKRDPRKAQITLRQLLTLTSGLDPRPPGSRRFKISYREAAAASSKHAPGAKFEYSPVPFQAFGAFMRKKLSARGFTSIQTYLEARLFKPLGLQVGSWQQLEGQPILPHGISLTARDWAKFGRFLIQEGRVGGKQLLPASLLATLRQGTRANPGYGLTFWLAKPVPSALKRTIPLFQRTDFSGHPLVPADTYMAAGAGDQRLYLIPSRELVIVRQARGVIMALLGKRSGFTDANLLARILHGKDAAGKALKLP